MSLIVITGGSGFLGQQLVRTCAEKGWQVRSADILEPLERLAGVEYIIADVCDVTKMNEIMRDADVVVHNAALVPLSRADQKFYEVNVGGTRTVLEAALQQQVKKCIYISSSAVYGIPDAPQGVTEDTPLAPFETYGRSKAEAEKVCHEFSAKLDVSIVRPRTILGPGRMGLMSLIFDWVAENRPVFILGSGANRYQFISAEALADVVVDVAEKPCQNQDFNVGTSRFGTLRQDLESFIAMVGSHSKVVSVPAGFARFFLPILSFLRLVPFVSYQYTIADHDVFFKTDKLVQYFGSAPQESNAEMLARTYAWYRTHQAEATASIHRKPLKKGILGLLKLVSKLF